MLSYLKTRIQTTGPLTVANYMREALTNPEWGYYMKKEVFGRQGDFTTSPEISQTFGEVVGAWLLHQWRATGASAPVRLIELGPGRGTLAHDILRTACQFPEIRSNLSVHMVEISPHMRSRQRKLLCPPDANIGKPALNAAAAAAASTDSFTESMGRNQMCLDEHQDLGVEYQTAFGVPISWHPSLEDVPSGHSLIIGHEFLDALPIHQFQKSDRGWREVLVDINDMEADSGTNAPPLRFVLSPKPTPALAYLEAFHMDSGRNNIEVCPHAGVVTQQIGNRLAADGGVALLVDYGETEPKPDFTFRSFHQHSLADELRDPGNADLTADVDFSYLRHIAERSGTVQCFGPIPQGYFLHSLGISQRVKVLLQRGSAKQRKQLASGLHYLTSPKKMGMRFKVFVMTPKQCVAPPPFVLR